MIDIVRASRALEVVGRWEMTVTGSGPGLWSIRDGDVFIAEFAASHRHTARGIAGGLVRSMRARGFGGVNKQPPQYNTIVFRSVRAPVVMGGGFTLGCIKPPPIDLAGHDLTDALALILHTLPPTETRCPACERRGGRWIWCYLPSSASGPGYRSNGWHYSPHTFSDVRPAIGPCPRCCVNDEPTGRVSQAWGAVLASARIVQRGHGDDIPCPRSCVPCSCDTNPETTDGADYDCPHHGAVERTAACIRDHRCICRGWGTVTVEDRHARERIAVLADQAMERGDPLGHWLALWLAGNPCPECEGAGTHRHEQPWGERPIQPEGCPERIEPIKDPGCGWAWSWTCPTCHGRGSELGALESVIADALDERVRLHASV